MYNVITDVIIQICSMALILALSVAGGAICLYLGTRIVSHAIYKSKWQLYFNLKLKETGDEKKRQEKREVVEE